MCSSIPTQSKLHSEVYEASKAISNRLLPSTSAYHEVIPTLSRSKSDTFRFGLKTARDKRLRLQGTLCKISNLYMALPTFPESDCVKRVSLSARFKISITVPPINDIDVYAHDIGLVAITDEISGGLAGFNVLVGGGMGMTHGSKKTYARLGQVLGFCSPKEICEVAEAIMLVQRDNGDRINRKHARYVSLGRCMLICNSLKYTIDDMGLDEFKRQVEERFGKSLSAPRGHAPFTKNIDDFTGWIRGDDGLYSHTIFIENGILFLSDALS